MDKTKVYEGPYDGGHIDIPLDGSPVRYLDIHIARGKVMVFVRCDGGATFVDGGESYKFSADALSPCEGEGA